jgi:hypothetical protein
MVYIARLLSLTDALLRGNIGFANPSGVILDPDRETGLQFASVLDTQVAVQRWSAVVECIVATVSNQATMSSSLALSFVEFGFALAQFLFKLSLGPVASQLILNDGAVVPCVAKCLDAARSMQTCALESWSS